MARKDFGKTEWRIPAERMKMKELHSVPASGRNKFKNSVKKMPTPIQLITLIRRIFSVTLAP